MKITIRDYQPDDFGVCRTLWVELTEHHREIYEDPTIGGDDPGWGFDAYIDNPQRQRTWVAEAEGQVVALSGLLVHGEEGEVEPVIVSSPYRNRGIGATLVRHVVQEAKNMGIRFLSIRPVARNEKVLSLFVRLGFNLVGYIDLFQDLSSSSDRKWKPGLTIHDNELYY